MNYIRTSHELAKELLGKPNGMIIANHKGEEYVIKNYKRETNVANNDDNTTYLTLNLQECNKGNIKSF